MKKELHMGRAVLAQCRFRLLNPQTAQALRPSGCKDYQKLFSRGLCWVSPRAGGSQSPWQGCSCQQHLLWLWRRQRVGSSWATAAGAVPGEGFPQSRRCLKLLQLGWEQGRWQSPANPDGQAKSSSLGHCQVSSHFTAPLGPADQHSPTEGPMGRQNHRPGEAGRDLGANPAQLLAQPHHCC